MTDTDPQQQLTEQRRGPGRPPRQHPKLLEAVSSDDFKAKMFSSLPPTMRGPKAEERFMRVVLNAFTRNPKLLECDNASIFKSLLDLAQTGLDLDGKRAHLVPFWNTKRNCFEAQFIPGYQGLADITRRSGEIGDIHADVIHSADVFSFSHGSDKHLRHSYPLDVDRGKVIGAYSFAKFKAGDDSFEVMPISELLKIKERTKSRNKAGEIVGPWVTDEEEMFKKTVFRRHSKWLPFSAEIRELIEIDDDNEPTERERFAAAKPVFDTSFLTPSTEDGAAQPTDPTDQIP